MNIQFAIIKQVLFITKSHEIKNENMYINFFACIHYLMPLQMANFKVELCA